MQSSSLSLFQRIQSSHLISDEILENAFKDAFYTICLEKGINLNDRQDRETVVSDLNNPIAPTQQPRVKSHSKKKKSRRLSESEESLSAYLRLPSETTDSVNFLALSSSVSFPITNDFDLLELRAKSDELLDNGEQIQDVHSSISDENKVKEDDNCLGQVSNSQENKNNRESVRSETASSDNNAVFSNLLTQETLERFEKILLKKLVDDSSINDWQASQLMKGRRFFHLGNYRIIDLLGKGGYGSVFLGRERELPSNANRHKSKLRGDVAVKVLPIKSKTPEAVLKFLREVEIAKNLKHSNLVRCYSSSEDASVYYSVSEYVNGGDARTLIAEHTSRNERLNYRAVAYIISETAKGLQYIHNQGLVHRDVKPGNILLMKSGEVKLADFGLASVIRNFRANLTFSPLGEYIEDWEKINTTRYLGTEKDKFIKQKFQVQGTPDYLAPDQLDQKNTAFPDPLWDIYSLGCSLYYMLTGVVPYPARDTMDALKAHHNGIDPPEPIEYDSSIPRAISQLTMKMMSRDPANRIKTAEEVTIALAQWIPEDVLLRFRLYGDGENFWSPSSLNECFVVARHTTKTLFDLQSEAFISSLPSSSKIMSLSPIPSKQLVVGASKEVRDISQKGNPYLERNKKQRVQTNSRRSLTVRVNHPPLPSLHTRIAKKSLLPPIVNDFPSNVRTTKKYINELRKKVERLETKNWFISYVVLCPLTILFVILLIKTLVKFCQ